MESYEESRSDRKHKAILEAATAVFLSKGYDGTTMDEIAASAGVSKQTVYKHFADKEQLFGEIVRATTDQIDGLMRLVAETLAVAADLDKGLSQLARKFLTALMEPRLLRLRRLVIANADRFPDVGRTWYEQGFGRVLATLATCFRRLAEHQLLDLYDPLLAANHFVGMLLWIPVNQAMFTGSVRRRSKAELEDYADAAVRAFLRAYSVKSEVAKSSVRSGRPSQLR